MSFGDYFSKSFSNIFHKDLYWPTFVLSIIYGIVIGIFGLIFSFGLGAKMLALNIMPNDPTALTNALPTLIAGAIGFLILGIIFGLVFWYFMAVLQVFLVRRISNLNKNKKIEFFEGFKDAFLPGLKLMIAQIIFALAIYVVILILAFTILLIPFVGIVLFGIATFFVCVYSVTGSLILLGKISNNEDFGVALGKAFSKSFSKLYWYSLVALLLIIVVTLVMVLFSLIPVIGWIASIFVSVAILVFFASLAAQYAQKK